MYIRFSSDSVATPKAHVVVATQYINDGTQVSPEMVKVVERPAHTLTLGAYYRDMIDVVGGRAMVDIASGEPITFLNFDRSSPPEPAGWWSITERCRDGREITSIEWGTAYSLPPQCR